MFNLVTVDFATGKLTNGVFFVILFFHPVTYLARPRAKAEGYVSIRDEYIERSPELVKSLI